MESNSGHGQTPAGAQAALDEILTDRQHLARRTTAPAWYYPVLAIITAVIVGSPAVGNPVWTALLIAGACAALVFIEYGFTKQTGLSTNRVPGPRTLMLLIGMGVLVLAMLALTAVLVTVGQSAWAVATTAIGFLTMFPGGLFYDRVYGRELKRGI
ncbi:MAG TPA: hypothetical protein K8V32_08355 [Enteractinococcus helveticum]|uniref:Uncharacterized protein n=1 Tax=Enteractinococcus helveticum TaxID=1837282 RepID=A0A921K983_9MICC|nr:hypothetical protein [Enteractinococcus helveticum]HJF14799.1 hypothetical protein [Enteractinococcus helveticum]